MFMKIGNALIGIFLFLSQSVIAQTVTTTPLGSQTLQNPISSVSNNVRKIQLLFTPSELAGARAGRFISQLYLRGNNPSFQSLNVFDLQIKLGQTTQTTFNGNTFFDSLQPVIYPTSLRSFTTSNLVGQYLVIPLDHFFQLDSTKSLIVEISSSLVNGFFNAVGTIRSGRQLSASSVGDTTGIAGNVQWNIGFDHQQLLPNDVRLEAILSPTGPTVTTPKALVQIRVRNASPDTLRMLLLHYSWKQQIRQQIWVGAVPPGALFDFTFNDSLVTNIFGADSLRAWCTSPNGGVDPTIQNNERKVGFTVWYRNGSFTVGRPTSDFLDLQTALTLMASQGINGPVELLMEPGTYQASYLVQSIPGSSSINTITIRPKPNTVDSVIILGIQGPTFTLNNASFIRLRNLVLRRNGFQINGSHGVLSLNNTNDVAIVNCTIEQNNLNSSASLNQSTLRIANSNNLNVRSCNIIGGYYGMLIQGTSLVPSSNIKVDSTNYLNPLEGAYTLFFVENFVFDRNQVQKFTPKVNSSSMMAHQSGRGFAITNNRINVRSNSPVLAFSNVTRGVDGPNMISNNLVHVKYDVPNTFLACNGSINSSTNFQFEHNNIKIQSPTSTSFYNYGIFNFGTNYLDSIRVINNAIQWTSPINMGSLFSFDSTQVNTQVFINNNLYSLPAQSQYAYISIIAFQYLRSFGQVPGWDTTSYVSLFEIDSARGYRAASRYISRLSNTSSRVTTDFTGRTRQLPISDLGAYEEPGVQRPILLHRILSDTARYGSRDVYFTVLTSSPLDTVTARLFYRRTSDPNWISVPATRLSGNEYKASIDYSLFPTNSAGRVQIQYYLLYADATQDWKTFPEGGSFTSAPVLTASYRISKTMQGTYRIGQGRDFPTLRVALDSLSGSSIGNNVVFLLSDTTYSIFSAHFIGSYQLQNQNLSVTIRPDLGKRVNIFTNQSASEFAFVIEGVTNFSFLGTDSIGGGSLRIFSNFGDTHFVGISDDGSSLNILFENITFQSNSAVTRARSGFSVFDRPGNLYSSNITIRNNKFIRMSIAFSLNLMNNISIENNFFGDSTLNIPWMGSIFSVRGAHNFTFQNNYIYELDPLAVEIMKIYDCSGRSSIINNYFVNSGIIPLTVFGTFSQLESQFIAATYGYDSLIVTGNHVSLRYPALSTGSNGIYNIKLFTLDPIGMAIPSVTPYTEISNNTFLLFGRFNNTVLGRARLFNFRIPVICKIYNNIFVTDLEGADTSRFQGEILSFTGPNNEILSQLDLSNNIFIRDNAGKISYLRHEHGTVDSSWILFRNRFDVTNNASFGFEFLGRIATFIPNVQQPPAFLSGYLKANGKPMAYTGVARFDRNGNPRTGGNNFKPDIGAYQINSSVSVEMNPPTIMQTVFDTTRYACAGTVRRFSAVVADSNSQVRMVELALWDKKSLKRFPMVLTSGNRRNGVWTGSYTVDTIDQKYELRFLATDSAGNFIWSEAVQDYTDFIIRPSIARPAVISTENPIRIYALSKLAYTLAFTEYTHQQSAPFTTPNLPAPISPSSNSFIEISNYGTDTVDLTGCSVRNYDMPAVFSFPTGYKLPPGRSLVLTQSGPVSSPANHYFNISFSNIFPLFSAPIHTIHLVGPDNFSIDELVLSRTIGPGYRVSSGWFGDGVPVDVNNSLFGGVQLVGMDIDNSRNWVPYSQSRPGTIGTFNSGIPRQRSGTFQWVGDIQGSGHTLLAGPLYGGNLNLGLNVSAASCSASVSNPIRVSGNDSTDFIRPFLSEFTRSADFYNSGCPANPRTISIRARDTSNGSGVSEVWLLFESSSQQSRRLLSRISGNTTNGIYRYDLSNEKSNGSMRLFAVDLAGNHSDTLQLGFFEGSRNTVTVSADTTISAGSQAVLRANSRNAHRRDIQLTEIVYFASNNMQPLNTYPPGILLQGSDDVFEITNMSDDSIFVGGLKLTVYTPNAQNVRNFPLPEQVLPPFGRIYLVAGVQTQVAPNCFSLPGFSFMLSSAQAGVLLIDTLGTPEYLTAVSLNGFSFPSSLALPTTVWSGGSVTGLTNTQGIFRSSNVNGPSGWSVATLNVVPTNLGSSIQLPHIAPEVSWFGPSGFLAVGNTLSVSPTQNTLYTAQIGSGSCITRDTVLVSVNGSSASNNIQVLGFVNVASGQTNPGAVQVAVRIRNTGSSPIASVPMELSVNGQLITNETLARYLAVGDSGIVSFNTPWRVPFGGMHRLFVRSNIVGDVQPNDDSLSIATLGTDAPNYAKITAILSPAAGVIIQDSALVRLRIVNAGTTTITSLTIGFNDGNQPLISQNFAMNLGIGQEQVVSFNKRYVPLDNIARQLCIRTITTFADQSCVQLGGVLFSPPTSQPQAVDVNLYPNPSSENITVELIGESRIERINVFDLNGREQMHLEAEFGSKSARLDISHLAQGLYFVLIHTPDGVKLKRLVIHR